MNNFPFEKSSLPVLGVDEQAEKVYGIGTCTLAHLDDGRNFLINCAHTINTWGESPIYIALPIGRSIELPFALKSKSKTVDKLDIAVTPLDGEFGAHFYDNDLTSNSLIDKPIPNKYKNLPKRVVFFGYPASRANIDLKAKRINSKSIAIVGIEVESVSEKTLETYDIDLATHLLASFSIGKMKDQNNKMKRAPKPNGISGGAVYIAYVEEGKGIDSLVAIDFVGIGTEYLQNISRLKATRKAAIADFIKSSF
ncbi:hypothetical protein [Mariprofundus ferrooxydans]|uniref:Trypsin-like peptidase domain-containing protein n=1 Tax=Mariprofundus ferrooxydans PV-1 TaxID=314345 RepID=Q0F3D4_9PROT|nr:hypothetical protein [Mariprofundus ferrooxydans]EAU56007.1 hypothetical protein SPV1_04283 [Mariprofundus ferrooxydans PV-1]KON48275.1 hypothetical protein AL013_04375 [Mariprofundus ferrooxydans]